MLSLETPPAAPPPGGATFGAGAEAQHQILELSTLENGHFQPPKGAVGVSLKRLRRTPPTGGEVIKVGLEKRQIRVFCNTITPKQRSSLYFYKLLVARRSLVSRRMMTADTMDAAREGEGKNENMKKNKKIV